MLSPQAACSLPINVGGSREHSGFDGVLYMQLADFLAGRLDAHAGIMALPDVYCLFNRARGTELVSPDDVLAAIRLFPSIGAALRLRTFSSGLLVVQSNSHSDAEVCNLMHVKGCVRMWALVCIGLHFGWMLKGNACKMSLVG